MDWITGVKMNYVHSEKHEICYTSVDEICELRLADPLNNDLLPQMWLILSDADYARLKEADLLNATE